MPFGSETNGIKLGSHTLLYQGITCFSTRFREKRVRLGSAFDRAGLDPVRSVGMDHERRQWFPRASGAEPPPRRASQATRQTAQESATLAGAQAGARV